MICFEAICDEHGDDDDDDDEDVEDDEDFVALFCQQLTREVVSNQRPPGPIPGRRR